MRQLVAFQLALYGVADRLRDIRTGKEKGASAVEYALLIALIAAVIVVAVYALGKFVFNAFSTTCSSIGSNSGITCDAPSLK